MIPGQLKLKLTKKQQTAIIEWLPLPTPLWNGAIRKKELDAKGGIYYTPKGLQNLAFSKDTGRGLFRAGHGQSAAAAAHGQPRSVPSCKSRLGGMQYIAVASKGSTRICSSCASTGPQGRAGLSVRQGTCSACGAHHDRDVNTAINTRIAAGEITVERVA
jgi:transposase